MQAAICQNHSVLDKDEKVEVTQRKDAGASAKEN